LVNYSRLAISGCARIVGLKERREDKDLSFCLHFSIKALLI
jgi:hypothetical protein